MTRLESFKALVDWLSARGVTEVECMVCDMTGIPRGKILPTKKFIANVREGALRLPESIFGQTVTGDFIESETLSSIDPDLRLDPDPSTVRIVPWYEEPTAQIICDAVWMLSGKPFSPSPRQVLKNVLNLYKERGWLPYVAPEIEFYLSEKNIDPDLPLQPPTGSNGRRENARQSYGIDAVNEFDKLFEDVYDFCEAQGLDIDTLAHEAGAAQVEINFNHGDALELADQTFLFKRTLRQTAFRHQVYATFMAKPFEGELGSAMHIHQNIVDINTHANLFVNERGEDTPLFRAYIGGLQKFLPSAMALIAPNVNSYRRIVKDLAAPINTHWGHENRTVGLRIPQSHPQARRIENRVPGADSNPYLAIATSLACGYIGMVNNLQPMKEMKGNAYASKRHALPRHLLDALEHLKGAQEIKDVLGHDFVQVYLEVKFAEHESYQQIVSAWEREHLLLNV